MAMTNKNVRVENDFLGGKELPIEDFIPCNREIFNSA
jgi:hypothetical protein